jgi:hypothetical protein
MPLQMEPHQMLYTINACLRNAGPYAATTCRPSALGFAATRVYHSLRLPGPGFFGLAPYCRDETGVFVG